MSGFGSRRDAAAYAAGLAMVYDSSERVRSQTDPDGATTTFTYGPDGGFAVGQTLVTDPVGHKTLETYQNGLLVSETKGYGTADAGTTSYTYDPVTLGVSTKTDADGNTETFTYDDHGNRTSASNALGFTTNYAYDDSGDLLETIDATGVATVNQYDQQGQIPAGAAGVLDLTSTTVTRANNVVESTTGNFGPAPVRTTSYYYDDPAHPGDRIRTVDPRGKTTTDAFDTFGDRTTSTDPLGNMTHYGYDTGRGLTTSTQDPLGKTTAYDHDPWGNVVKTTDPLGHTDSAVYDADGQKTADTDANGRTVTTSYDPDGKRISLADGTGTSTWTYDTFGEVVAQKQGSGTVVGYGYDENGDRTSVTYPGQSTPLTRTFDDASRLATVTDWNGNKTAFGYNADSHLLTTSYPTGTTITNTYDDSGFLSGTSAATGTATVLAVTYGRDAQNQLASQTTGGGAQSYGYTPREQLASTTSGGSATAFGYDAANNPTTVATATQAFDPAGQLCWTLPSGPAPSGQDCATVPSGATTYASDALGQRTKATPAAGTASNYGYDQAGRLTSATGPGGSASYVYDGSGQRVAKTVGGVTSAFVWDISSPANVLSDSANAYVYGPDGLPIEQIGAGGTTWFVHDQIGSTLALLDSSGAVTGGYTYTPFGLATHTGAASTPLQFTGQYTDAETGFVHLRSRYYDPATALFLTVDPLSDISGTPYAYANDNPLNWVDPNGQWSILGAIAGGLLAGGAVIVSAVLEVGTGGAATPAVVAGDVALWGLVGYLVGGAGSDVAHQVSAAMSTGRNPSWGYVPAPKTLPGFPNAVPAKGKTPVQGGGGTRKRWINDDGCILEWDSQHGAVEKYSKNGRNHLGEFDPDTGEQTKDGDPTRRVEK